MGKEGAMKRLYGGIEAGGTKFVCMVATDPAHVVEEKRFPTTRPDETIRQANLFFSPYAGRGQLAAVGIASFGPLDLNPASLTYGYITSTPKTDWNYVDLHGLVARALDLPTAFDTDVNAAAFGEHYWTAGNNSLDPFVYMTVGTGIGMGVLANGRPLHGLVHTEAGHFAIPHDRQKDPVPWHLPISWRLPGRIGFGSGDQPALGSKCGTPAGCPSGLGSGSGVHRPCADELDLRLFPQRIVLGGGVSQHVGLHAAVRLKVQQGLNGYIQSPVILNAIDEYIVPPSLGNRSGVLGAIAMAIDLVKP